jgi:monoamine oxidase
VTRTPDVIVVGAGFAGCSAAREVRRAGLEPLLVEARDRIGGRTWTDEWHGQEIERGGGWVHWFQPHVWSEVTAHGLTPEVGPRHEACFWHVGGRTHSGDYGACEAATARGWDAFVAGSEEMLPLPHDPLHDPAAIARLDGLTMSERIEELDLDDEALATLIPELEGVAHAPLDRAGALTAVRWHALAGHSLPLIQESGGGDITLAEGTRGLITPIHDEAGAETLLSTPIAAVRQTADRVVVETAAGDELDAAALVLAVPLNVLHDIRFGPELPTLTREAIAYGQASSGIKLFVRARGPRVHASGLHPKHPFSYIVTQWLYDDGTQIMIGFGPDHSVCRPDDLDWVQRELDRVIPGFEVLDATAHDWQADPFSQGTWAVHRPGWYTRFHRAMGEPHGRLVFAGADFANGWTGFIDGAIESGTRGGRAAARIASA